MNQGWKRFQVSAELLGCLYGWRANRFNYDNLTMTSPHFRQFVWGSNEPLRCTCANSMAYLFQYYARNIEGTELPHKPPEDWCCCGWYMYKTLEAYYDDMDYKDDATSFIVVILAKAWGRVIEHEQGYRSEYIQADTVFLPDDKMEFAGYIQQIMDVVVEPLSALESYDKNLPQPVELPVEGDKDGKDR